MSTKTRGIGPQSNDEIPMCSLDAGNVAPDDAESRSQEGRDSLPMADGGKAAWRMLLSAFIFEALFWGRHLDRVQRLL
jgi:hypothetical protein